MIVTNAKRLYKERGAQQQSSVCMSGRPIHNLRGATAFENGADLGDVYITATALPQTTSPITNSRGDNACFGKLLACNTSCIRFLV